MHGIVYTIHGILLSLARHISLRGRVAAIKFHRSQKAKPLFAVAIAISLVLVVAAVMASPLVESKEWSCWPTFALLSSCLVASVVVIVVVMMLVLVVVDVVLFCFPPLPPAKVVPMHQWLYDPLVYTPSIVE
jgi:hypothetical protein